MFVEWKRNLVAHGDAREKWRGKRQMEWVASSLQLDSEQSIQCYYYRSPLTRTPRKPVLDWTATPADINGLVRFAGRPNLVSALVPSHSVFTLLLHSVNIYSSVFKTCSTSCCWVCVCVCARVLCVHVCERQRARARVHVCIRGLLEKYPTFGREKETGLLGALDT